MKPAVFLLLAALALPAAAQDLRPLMAKAEFQTPSKPLASTDFELPILDGGKVKLSALKGSVVLLNFWATWCPPCRAEIPSMEVLHSKLKDKGLRVLAVDLAEETAKVRDFVKKNKMEVTVLLDSTGQIGGAYGASSIPTTYVIGRDGAIIARTVGSRDWGTQEMLSLFETVLASK
jgi:thiol-disulfide isomerase/thioredoxin